MDDRKELKDLELELERLRDLAADMFEEKYSKKAQENHRRIRMIERRIRNIKGDK